MAEVRKLGVEDLLWGTGTYTSPAGTVVTRIPTATPSGSTFLGVYSAEAYGATGNGSTDDTSVIMDAVEAAYAAGGGKVVFEPGKTYVVEGLYPRNNVVLDLNGATLQLKDGATYGILDWQDTTYALDASARHHFHDYVPDGTSYTGGFYNFTAGTIAAGAQSVTLATASEAANFSAGDIAMIVSGSDTSSYRVVENIEVASASGSTGVVTFKWPIQKYHEDTGTYFGMAKKDSGYVSGRGFKMMNGTLDGGTTATASFLINYEGMDMDFIDLEFKGQADYYYNIRGTNCRLIRPRMRCKNTTLNTSGGYEVIPFSIDVGATNNVVAFGVFECETAPGFFHLGEGHSGTKFLYNVVKFAPATTTGGASQYNGTTGLTFIGNTFYNFPGIVVGGGAFPDNTPQTQVWIGNEFYGQFTGALIFLSERTGTPDPTLGHVIFANNTAIGTINTSLVAGGSPNVLRALYNATVTGNYIRIVDSSTGAINQTDPSSIDFDTVVLKDNIGLPDIKRRVFTVDDFTTLHDGATNYNSYPDASDHGFPVMRTAHTTGGSGFITWSPQVTDKGGKVGIYAKAIWVNLGSGSGDIYQYWELLTGKLGTALDNTVIGNGAALTMGAAGVPTSTGYFGIATNGTTGYTIDFLSLEFRRAGENAADTLTDDTGLLALELIAVPISGY